MRLEMAIYLTDQTYSKRFVKYLKESNKDTYQITSLDCMESLIKYIQHHKVDLLFLQDQIQQIPEIEQKCKNIVYLTEDDLLVCEYATDKRKDDSLINHLYESEVEQKRCVQIYQYQSAEQILEILKKMDLYQETTRNLSRQRKKKKIISLISLEGSSKAEQVARQISSTLEAMASILYVNLTQFNDSNMLQQSSNKSFSDLIYYLNSETDNQEISIKDYIFKDKKIEYIPPVNNGLDLIELKSEHIDRLLDLTSEQGYEFIIFRVSMLNEATVRIFETSSAVIHLVENPAQRQWANCLKVQLEQILEDESMRKYHAIELSSESEENVLPKEIYNILEILE